MPIAIFANKVFQVDSEKAYTFYDFQYNSSLQTEQQDAEGTKPSTYNKGPALDSLSFKIRLDISDGINPRKEWDEWLELMNSGAAYPFILGSRPLSSNKWLIVGVSPSDIVIDNSGNIISLLLSLQFDEYVRPGSVKESNASKVASNSPGIVDNLLTNIDPEAFGIEDKTSQKRNNPNMKNYSSR